MKQPLLIVLALTAALLCINSGCTMGHGAFEGLNPLYWLKPSTYIERHRQHEQAEEYQRTNHVNK